MDSVSQQLRAALAAVRLSEARRPYVSNHRARMTSHAAAIGEDLILNVSRQVRWHDSVTLLYELGCRLFIEPAPGEVLSNLVKDAFVDARAVALEKVPLETAVVIVRRGSATQP